MLCIATGGTILALAASAFTLSWTHSVERTEWRETWRVMGEQLAVVEASVQGSGAGIYLPDDAVMTGDGWTYKPGLAPLSRLVLAASGATPSGWTLCADDACLELGAAVDQPVQIWVGAACEAPPVTEQ